MRFDRIMSVARLNPTRYGKIAEAPPSGAMPTRVPPARNFAPSPAMTTSDAQTSPSPPPPAAKPRSEEHTSELQSLMRISYAVFCLKKKNTHNHTDTHNTHNY